MHTERIKGGLAASSALLIATLLGSALPQHATAQQLYRWVDKDGKVTYSQNPPPAGAAKSVQQKNLTASVVSTSELPYESQQAAKNFPVTVFTSPDCGDPCKSGVALLAKRGVPYKEISVTDNDTIAEMKRASGGNQVPALVVGHNATSGFLDSSWNSALDVAGYPKSIPAGVKPQVIKVPPKAPPEQVAPAAAPTPSAQNSPSK
jgi:glutaredoxin